MQGRWNQTRWKTALYLNRISIPLVLLPTLLMRLNFSKTVSILGALLPMLFATVAFLIFINLPAGAKANYNKRTKNGHDIHTNLEGYSAALVTFLAILFLGGVQIFLLLKIA